MSGVEIILGTIAIATAIGNTITTANNLKKAYKWIKCKEKRKKDIYDSWQLIDNEEVDEKDFVKIELSNM
ncbi:MAG: hypothetical protein CXT73_02345 [Methanobacteriota archaeon]|nr:MAG: hypothetical protein CXT73_02345 [Euryarchaeota archaeon]